MPLHVAAGRRNKAIAPYGLRLLLCAFAHPRFLLPAESSGKRAIGFDAPKHEVIRQARCGRLNVEFN
jgi:hypothetical protein